MITFCVKRTSFGCGLGASPCDGAYLGKCRWTDVRTVSEPGALRCMSAAEWYADGENHRVIDGRICRDFYEEAWLIDLDDAGLLHFIRDNGECSVEFDKLSGTWRLEIIDDVRY